MLTAIAFIALLPGALARQITVTNNCGYTIWPAMFTAIGTAPTYPGGSVVRRIFQNS